MVGTKILIVYTCKDFFKPFNVKDNQRSGTYEISMKIHVPSNMELDKVISQLKTLRHVMRVNRV